MPPDHAYCDVALPIPIDHAYTYAIPSGLRGAVQPGCRVVAPFGPRRLTGVVLSCHHEPPEQEARDLLKLLDPEPVLSAELLALGRWVADYYCAPIGETLKSMLPLGGEVRSGRIVSISDLGRSAVAQFRLDAEVDPQLAILRALERRPLKQSTLQQKFPGAVKILGALERRGLLTIEIEIEPRDPLRARDGRLVVKLSDPAKAPQKPNKGQRWLLDFLSAHPGEHDIEPLSLERKDVAAVARKLADRGAVRMRVARKPLVAAAVSKSVTLSPAQRSACAAVEDSVRRGVYRAFLLQGVTGSGKTEVYMRAIAATLEQGRSALLLVPEIGLTPQVASQFFARFGDQVAILHSAFSGWQRSEQWRRIRSGEARVVIGARSGVFAPLDHLGLIIVDEEHESSYKQDETPRYHGRDVAVMRAARSNAAIVLGSATPSLESRHNVDAGKYTLLEMPDRIERRPMPQVEIVDMRREFVETGRNDLFSRSLAQQIQHKLDAGEQTMLLLNRRGFSMYALCRECGHRVQCQNCSVTLTYHKRERRLLCHYCEYAEPVPEKCAECGGEKIYFQGSGSEKVEQTLRELLPKARIARMDRDSITGKDHYETVLSAFREGRYDILVGTQMIAKGHDIPSVTLVGVVSADVGLGVPDFRAAERTFQLLTQVAGRAGRGESPGKVVFQTIEPTHYAVKFAAAQDYADFYKKESYYRRQMHYPPFAALALLLVRSRKLEEALSWSAELERALQDLPSNVRKFGPAAAAVHKLKTEYRYQFLLKSPDRTALAPILRQARQFAEQQNWPAAALVINVDPMSLL